MKSLLIVVGLLVAGGFSLPQDQKGTDSRLGLDRPSTEKPPEVSGDLDSYLCQVFGTSCGSEGGKEPGPNPGPDNNGGGGEYQPNPPNQPENPPDNYVPEPQYPPNPPTSPNPYPPGGGGGDDCSCVQYYLCNDNNTLNEDGVGLIDIRLKDECSNYLEKCCGNVSPTPNYPPMVPRNSKCGNRNPEGIGFRITGNKDNEAQYAEFPWMVAVVRPDQSLSNSGKSVSVYQCGGSLIHPQVVLTGAHCVSGKDNLVVRAGEWDTQTKNELYPTQDRPVRKVIIHENFHSGTLANDPALLILESPVDMSEQNVGLICLPEQNESMDGRDCVASGWGKDLFGKEGRYQVILKRVDLPTVPRPQCIEALRRTRLGQRFKLHESFICAGGQRGKDTCKGDGGSPLVCPSRSNPNVYVQAGIVAWGIDCATETPGVYVSVPYFVNWINNKLYANDISLDSN